MSEQQPILLPPRTRQQLDEMVRQRDVQAALLQQQNAAIAAVVEAARECLSVPEGWALTNTAAGFVAPAEENR